MLFRVKCFKDWQRRRGLKRVEAQKMRKVSGAEERKGNLTVARRPSIPPREKCCGRNVKYLTPVSQRVQCLASAGLMVDSAFSDFPPASCQTAASTLDRVF